MKSLHSLLSAICVTAASLVAAGCGGGGSPESGQLTLRVTDAPIDSAERVVVEFTGVEIKARAGGRAETFEFATPRQIDLLALEGGGSEILLENEELPAGEYEWIRLMVNAGLDASDSFIELENGSRHALFIPSGNETGLKLVSGFTVGVGSSVDFTIDFDLRKSVIAPPGLAGPHILRPALRLVNTLQVGMIEGLVDATVASAPDCSAAVYLFSGSNVTPDDEGSATPPITTTRVAMDTDGTFPYRIAFVPSGNYTVALTCDAAADGADADDAIDFLDAQNVSVTAGATSTVDLGG